MPKTAAVATDLVTRGITTAEQLGARGGSNGGLLMGISHRVPEKFGALVCDAAAGHEAVPPAAGRRFLDG